MKTEGSLLAPTGEGTFRVVDLRVGQSVIGSIEGNLKSDGATADLEMSTAMTTRESSGGYTLTLGQPYDLSGKISIRFFFQAEDGIRDPLVTGVQTCALPI